MNKNLSRHIILLKQALYVDSSTAKVEAVYIHMYVGVPTNVCDDCVIQLEGVSIRRILFFPCPAGEDTDNKKVSHQGKIIFNLYT